MILSILLVASSSLVIILSYRIRSLEKEQKRLHHEGKEDSKVLFLKSRYASMGETVGNIAHQWKQPLNAIAAIQNSIKAALIFQGDISKEKLLDSVETSFKLLQHLGSTIDTFYRFLSHQKNENMSFVIADELETIRKITEYSFENSNIKLLFVLDANPTVQGDANEFTHAMLNLILNAKDAFDSKHTAAPIITVRVTDGDNIGRITVTDNAGGIRIEPIDMVFNLHITSKENGSGLGLFMTKNIIENRFGGTISVENKNNGACFTITLPYAEYGDHYPNTVAPDEKLTLDRINQLSRKVIELEEVEKALNKWADIFKQAHWAIAIHIGTSNTFELTNSAFHKLYGYTPMEFKSLSVPDLFITQSLPILATKQKEAFEKGYIAFESVHKRKDGSTFPVSVELIVIKDDDGEILYHIANIWDISEKKTAEERLLLKKFALDHIKDAVFMIDENACFHYVNDGACNALGYTHEEFTQMNVGNIDPSWPKERWPEHWNILKEVGSMTMELQHRRKDGTTFPVEVSANYIEYEGKSYNMAIARDITERKAAEKDLLLLDKALNNTNEATFIMLSERIIQVNDGACRMLGYSRNELESMNIFELDPDITEEAININVSHMLTNNKNLRFDTRHRTKDGRILDVEIDTSVFEYDGVIYSFSAVRDITEQKRAREELLLKEFALNTVNEAVFLIDKDSMFHYVNEGACAALGYTKDELTSMGVTDLDPNFPFEQWKIHWEEIKEQKTTLTLTQHQRKDGTIFPIEISSNYFEFNGIGYSLAVSRDITERLQLEVEKETRALKTIAENVPDNIARWDAEGRYLYINPVQERLLGVTPADIIGKRLGEAFPEIDFSVLDRAIAQVVKMGESIQFLRQLVPTEDGMMDIHEINLVPERDANGTIVSVLGVGRDMTNIYRLQDELAKREQELRALADSSPGMMGVFHMRPDGSIYMPYVSPNLIDIFGLQPENVKDDASSIMALTHPEDLQRVYDSINESAQSMCVWHEEYRIIHPTKGERWMESNTMPQPHPDGGIVWYGYVHDVTERKKLENLLEKERKFLIDAQRVAHTGSWYLDIQNSVLSWSDETYRIFELEKEDVDNLHTTFYEYVHPDDREMMYAPYVESLEAKLPYEVEHRIVMRDGRIKHVIERCEHVYDHSGTPLYSIGTVQDITERKLMEMKLEDSHNFLNQLVNSIHDPIFVKDREHRWIMLNDANIALTGFPRETLIGKSDHDIFPKEQADIFWEKDEAVFNSGNININEEYFTSSDGIIHCIETIKSMFTASNGIEYLVGTIRDISERKKNEEMIKELNATLEEKVKERTLQLQKSLELNEGVINAIPDLLFEIDINGRYMNVWAQNPKLLAAQKELMLGRTVHDVLSKEAANTVIEALQEAYKENSSFGKIIQINLDQRARYFELSVSKKSSDDTFLVLSRDITERKEAVEAVYLLNTTLEDQVANRTLELQKALEFNEGIINAIPDLLFEIAPDGTYIGVWAQNKKLLSTQKEMLLNKNFKDILPPDVVNVSLQTMKEVDEKGHSLGNTYSLDLPDGKRWFELSVSKKKSSGNYIVLSRDITQRRLAEEKIQNLNATLEKRVFDRTAQLEEAVMKLHKEITERKMRS